VLAGDWIQAEFDEDHNSPIFTKEAEGLEVQAMASMMGDGMLREAAGFGSGRSTQLKSVAKPAKK
jgi:hypothetical protein